MLVLNGECVLAEYREFVLLPGVIVGWFDSRLGFETSQDAPRQNMGCTSPGKERGRTVTPHQPLRGREGAPSLRGYQGIRLKLTSPGVMQLSSNMPSQPAGLITLH